ncbi:MAG: AAA family ATPase [Lachnospiraceae bacterium]|nr:AAA family ATPase [Lachnospiraceae bacterium]
MKIKKIHIEQFGSLSNLNMVFHAGCNRICQENGWGKTTLAVFIRAMFYGFPAKGEGAKDRIRYRPWGNGIYGGSLTFQVEGHCYTVYRVFGKSKSGSDDEFHLIDEETRMESSRWSSDLGSELFAINEESYTNSAWIRQDGCIVTSDMTSRLGDNSAFLEDIRQFDQVSSRLEKHLTRLSPERKTGLIYKKRLEKQELSTELLRIPATEKRMQDVKKKIAAKEEELRILEEDRSSLQKTQKEYCDWQDFFSMRELHDTLQREYLMRDEIWENYQKKYPDGIPEETKTEDWMLEKAPPAKHAGGIFLLSIVFLLAALIQGNTRNGAGSIFWFAAGILAVIAVGTLLWERGNRDQKRNGEKTAGDNLGLLLVKQREVAAAENAWKELQKADQELRRFYENNPEYEEMSEGEIPSHLAQIRSVGQLNERLNNLNTEVSQTKERLQDLRQELTGLFEERSRLSQKEDDLEEVTAELEKMEKEYRITAFTAKHLAEAKENFSARFLDSIQSAFLSYYRLIDPDQKEMLYIDAAYRICTMGGGLPRTEEVLSDGYRNLAAFCLRLALLDAMYEKEAPCIILDDPFVHLDQKKYERAMSFLQELSGKYQILYFSGRE